jgi:hypothetical protein
MLTERGKTNVVDTDVTIGWIYKLVQVAARALVVERERKKTDIA